MMCWLPAAACFAAEVVEPTGEEAAEPAPIPTRNMLTIMRDGGILMYPIAGCSFVMLTFALERWYSLRRARVIPKPFIKRFLHQLLDGQLDRGRALELCEESDSVVARVLAAGVKRWGRPAVEVEQAILDAGERAVADLRRNVRVFNAIATITPLLGLLGTVFGMIQAFNSIASSQALGRPELLAKGISEALLTTAAGLTVAIPSLSIYLFFLGRIDRLIMDLDALGQEVVAGVSAEGLQENTRLKARSRRAEAA
jgi:biopolymer transport protein ExbB